MRNVGVLYAREMRAALRERSIVVNSIVIPVVLYPFIMWAMFTGIMFVRGQTDRVASRVMLLGVPAGHEALTESLSAHQVRLVVPSDTATAMALMEEGAMDALVEFEPLGLDSVLQGAFSVRLTGSESRERSQNAMSRVTTVLERYRDDRLSHAAGVAGLSAREWQWFDVETENRASGKEMGSFLLGLMLPMFFLIMTAVGCFHPAVDATAGERERSTWETTMSLGVSRSSIVTAKYLSVATFGSMAGLLNLGAMTLTMGAIVKPLLAGRAEDIHFVLPWAGLPVMAAGAVLLAGFIAAVMMLFASFARTFKEGQAMITPFYLLMMVPAILLQQQGLAFSMTLALVPVANVVMMIREAIAGVFHWPQIALTVAVGLGLVAASLRLAGFVLRFEDVVVGSYGGSLTTLLKERLRARGSRARGGAI
ncbi:MAG: ABC transporter permease subunit [Candidatus Eisenbacteria bacterium]|jgi:ABC-type Na+ efflux pump permease subunit|nr:ABC transporter permease subunit [Candidatus Eisenbacteria bacterium]